jgi:dimethylamine/trimethylamine dehydrogenase
MPRNPRYDILFEPVRIGPVVARNRFFQVPHASGMTNAMPRMRAAFREVKAEGGWGVVCTGYSSIDASADDLPLPYGRLWTDDDIRAYAPMVDAVHRHGALAGIELWHGGGAAANRFSRIPPLSPSGSPWMSTHPGFMSNLRPRAMDKSDIRALCAWQAKAARRASNAGFDIVYVYAGMGYLPHQFLLKSYNRRDDDYGGSLENRSRLLRELIEATKEAVGDRCAVAVRLSVEELLKEPGRHAESEAHELIASLGELPDLWDVKLDSAPADCPTARFSDEGYQEPLISFVKTLTTKPVVGVGRFTSPDAMVAQIRRGSLDLIGAARPSIADPFLPKKIDEGREDEIRECIGCNICISSWHDGVPIRCTQNPTVGEEWRRGWHPEDIPVRGSEDRILIVGGGPAGLESARALGQRGYHVTVAEAGTELGGRLRFEAGLPGLATWMRVRDYRLARINEMANVEVYLDSELTASDILEFGFDRVVLATGSRWTPELYSANETVAPALSHARIHTPDDVAAGAPLEAPVVIFDFDNYYMGSCLAELLARRGLSVHLVTPAGHVSAWTIMNNELPRIHARLRELEIDFTTLHSVVGFDGDCVELSCVYSGRRRQLPCRSLVVVGLRRPHDALYRELDGRADEVEKAGIRSLTSIGDAVAPGTLAHAVYSGHRFAREVDDTTRRELLFRLDAPLGSGSAPAPLEHRDANPLRVASGNP